MDNEVTVIQAYGAVTCRIFPHPNPTTLPPIAKLPSLFGEIFPILEDGTSRVHRTSIYIRVAGFEPFHNCGFVSKRNSRRAGDDHALLSRFGREIITMLCFFEVLCFDIISVGARCSAVQAMQANLQLHTMVQVLPRKRAMVREFRHEGRRTGRWAWHHVTLYWLIGHQASCRPSGRIVR